LSEEGNVNFLHYELKNENGNILENYIDSISFLEIKEEEGYYFSTINKLIINEDNIFILDVLGSHSLLNFNKNGNFVRQIGTKGTGPDEYTMFCDFDINSQYVFLNMLFFHCICFYLYYPCRVSAQGSIVYKYNLQYDAYIELQLNKRFVLIIG
jgi:hypothetical protein